MEEFILLNFHFLNVLIKKIFIMLICVNFSFRFCFRFYLRFCFRFYLRFCFRFCLRFCFRFYFRFCFRFNFKFMNYFFTSLDSIITILIRKDLHILIFFLNVIFEILLNFINLKYCKTLKYVCLLFNLI